MHLRLFFASPSILCLCGTEHPWLPDSTWFCQLLLDDSEILMLALN